MKLIDSHCHPQFSQYDLDREAVLKRALNGGVQMVCVGTDLEMSAKAIDIASQYDGVWATVGIHPNDLPENVNLADYAALFNQPKVVAIGEVGLDYYRTKAPQRQEKQRAVFRQFLELAQTKNLPIIIHSRAAFADTYKLVSQSASWRTGLRAVIHSFTYTWAEAQQFLALGLYIGLNGIITFTDQYDETVKNVPLDRILLETDAPFLAPVPYRGQRNEPAHVIEVAKKIAGLRNITIREVAQATVENTKKLFILE